MSSDYKKWNELIFRKIFNEDNANRAVSIYVDGDLLDSWYNELVGLDSKHANVKGAAHFIECCKEFLLREPKDIAVRISMSSRDWRDKGFKTDEAPSFIGLLALLVLASSWGSGRFSASSFYPRYWDMMGHRDRVTTIPDIQDVRNAWSALQDWTESNNLMFGSFRVRTLSATWKYVGIIIAQGLLRPDDETELRNIFFEFGADKELDYPDATLSAWISERIGNLSSRARAAFESEVNKELFLERIRQELEMWNGEPADAGDLSNRVRSLRKQAFLCLVDKPEPCFTLRVDLSSRDGDPDMLKFKDRDGTKINLKAPSNGSPLSLPLKQVFINDGVSSERSDEVYRINSSSALTFLLQQTLCSTYHGSSGDDDDDCSSGHTYRFSGSNLRIFAKVPASSLTDYIEVGSLRRNLKHILMVDIYHPELERIESWANRFAPVSKIELERYTPKFMGQTRWKLISIGENVREIDGAGIPQLRFERKKIGKLEGGLRFYGSGNKYFKNLPPKLSFDTVYPVRVKIGQKIIEVTNPSAPLELESSLSAGYNQIHLEELRTDGIEPETAEIQLSLHDSAEWAPEGPGKWSNESDSPITISSKPLLIGCRTGEILPSDKSEDLNATWIVYSLPQGAKIAIPCTNLLACKNGIKKINSDNKFQYEGRVPPPNLKLEWLRTLRESKLHPLVKDNPESKITWTDLQNALDTVNIR